MDAVVAHVAHPAQHHALGKVLRTLAVSPPEAGEAPTAACRLPASRSRRSAAPGVWGRLRPSVSGPPGLRWPARLYPGRRARSPPVSRREASYAPRSPARREWPASPLPRSRARPGRPRRSRTRNGNRPRRRCSAGPATRGAWRSCRSAVVHGGRKYRLSRTSPRDLVPVHPLERRDAVVVCRNDGTGGVEETHGGEYRTSNRRVAPATARLPASPSLHVASRNLLKTRGLAFREKRLRPLVAPMFLARR